MNKNTPYLKILALTIIPFFFNGCEFEKVWGDVPFYPMEQSNIILGEQVSLCKKTPDSIFCINVPAIGDIEPTREYSLSILREMNRNFKYKADDTWHYHQTVHEYLKGDCEDIASTMAQHMINDGIDPSCLAMVYRKTGENSAHHFLAVKTDGKWYHFDYGNSGYLIEPNINFYMKMDNVGIHNWVKGNIR